MLILSLILVLFSQTYTQVPLTKELLASVAAARTRYHVHLETERKKSEAEAQALKRKGVEDHLQELRVKRRRLQEVSEGLARDADRLAEEAEGKARSKMADLISKSNLLRRAKKRRGWRNWLSLTKRLLPRVQGLGVDFVSDVSDVHCLFYSWLGKSLPRFTMLQ